MSSVATASSLFYVFYLFQGIQANHLAATRRLASMPGSALELAPIDRMMWLEPRTAIFFSAFLFLARLSGIAFLIYFGFQTEWFYPALLYGMSFVLALIGMAAIDRSFGLARPSLLGVPIIFGTGVAMFLVL